MLSVVLALFLNMTGVARAGCELTVLLGASQKAQKSDVHRPLSEFVNTPQPWEKIPSNAEQFAGLSVGRTAYERAQGLAEFHRPRLDDELNDLAIRQAQVICGRMHRKNAEFELWPFVNDEGKTTWVFARWRDSSSRPWKWLNTSHWSGRGFRATPPFLPLERHPADSKDQAELFNAILDDDLYTQPEFGNAVFTSGRKIEMAWGDPETREQGRSLFAHRTDVVAHLLPQPARFDAKPFTFVLKVGEKSAQWKTEVDWIPAATLPTEAVEQDVILGNIPPGTRSFYEDLVRRIAGEKKLTYPISKRRLLLERKNPIDPANQLEAFVDLLEEYYAVLGFKDMHRPRYKLDQVPWSNLMVRIKGSKPPGENRALVVIDHIDTAFAENIFYETGERTSVKGADDNATAVAGIMTMARLLKDGQPEHDIILAHVNGEEYPADDMGSRMLVQYFLKTKQKIQGVFVMDMLGRRFAKDRGFQVNVARGEESNALARVLLDAGNKVAKKHKPVIISRNNPDNYGYNTDSATFEFFGIPSVHCAERMNPGRVGRAHYHTDSDTTKYVDFSLAYDVVISTAEAVARLARLKFQRP